MIAWRPRIFTLLATMVAFTLWPALDSAAQPKARRGGGRPGEIITPAAHSERPKETLKVGDAAPAFTLPLSKGGETSLADLCREKPLVLVFGSISCPPFRRQIERQDPRSGPGAERLRYRESSLLA